MAFNWKLLASVPPRRWNGSAWSWPWPRSTLVSQGTHLVETGQRRRVDAHWFRGSSYLKIGWNWIRRALSRKEKLLNHVALSPKPDPEPAMASRKQHHKRMQPHFYGELGEAA